MTNIQHRVSLVVGLAIETTQANPLPGPGGKRELRAPPSTQLECIAGCISFSLCYY